MPSHGLPVRVVEEPRRGLSSARNAGLRAAHGDLVAFTDDDVVLDRAWVGALAAGMERAADVACVTGKIRALALGTPAQHVMEAFAALDKGTRPRVWRLGDPEPSDPLFPYGAGAFGSGASTMLRAVGRARARRLRPAAGRGHAGLRRRGPRPLRARPARRARDRLRARRRAVARPPGGHAPHAPRGVDLRRRPDGDAGQARARRAPDAHVLGLVPKGLSHLNDPASRKNAGKDAGFPRALERLERAGMFVGPWAYLASAARSTDERTPEGTASGDRSP